MMTKTKFSEVVNTLYATSITIDKLYNINIRGYYENDNPKKAYNIPYTKSIADLYEDIRKKRIVIHDTANSYKWFYILWNISLLDNDCSKKIDLFQSMIEKYIISKHYGKSLDENFIIQINENRFVHSSNRRKYFFTSNKNEAKIYNKFQATFVLRIMKRAWGNDVKLIKL